jgi:hypothetical protein
MIIPFQRAIYFKTRLSFDDQDDINSSFSTAFDEDKGSDAVENVQTFGFLAPILFAVARLRARLRVDRAEYATDLAEHPAVEAASDHPPSPAVEAIRIVCKHSSPPGA